MKTINLLIFASVLFSTNVFSQSIGIGGCVPAGIIVDGSTLGDNSKYGIYGKFTAHAVENKVFKRFGLSIGVERKFEIVNHIFSVGLHGSVFYNNTTSESVVRPYTFFEGGLLQGTAGGELAYYFNNLPVVVRAYYDLVPFFTEVVTYKVGSSNTSVAKDDTFRPSAPYHNYNYNQPYHQFRNYLFRQNKNVISFTVGYSF